MSLAELWSMIRYQWWPHLRNLFAQSQSDQRAPLSEWLEDHMIHEIGEEEE